MTATSVGGCECGVHRPGSVFIRIRFALLANRGHLILSTPELEALLSMSRESQSPDDEDTVDIPEKGTQ